MRIVFCTASSVEEAERIANRLVEGKLAACCNIVPNLKSIYSWEGKICRDNEVLIIIKTSDYGVDRITSAINEMHSYQLPEIVAVPVVGGSETFMEWVDANSSER